MPVKTVLFDQRVRMLHDFGSSPTNYISFNPKDGLFFWPGLEILQAKWTSSTVTASPACAPSTRPTPAGVNGARWEVFADRDVESEAEG